MQSSSLLTIHHSLELQYKYTTASTERIKDKKKEFSLQLLINYYLIIKEYLILHFILWAAQWPSG